MEPETKAGDRSPKAGMDQPARETAGVLKVKEVVVGGSEEASAPPLLAHPCSLLQLLLSACAGCLGLSGYCSDDAPKPAAKGDNDAAAPAVAEPPREGAGGGGGDGEAPSYLYLQDGTPSGRPDSPRQGGGGDGEAPSYLYLQDVSTPLPPGPPREGPGPHIHN